MLRLAGARRGRLPVDRHRQPDLRRDAPGRRSASAPSVGGRGRARGAPAAQGRALRGPPVHVDPHGGLQRRRHHDPRGQHLPRQELPAHGAARRADAQGGPPRGREDDRAALARADRRAVRRGRQHRRPLRGGRRRARDRRPGGRDLGLLDRAVQRLDPHLPAQARDAGVPPSGDAAQGADHAVRPRHDAGGLPGRTSATSATTSRVPRKPSTRSTTCSTTPCRPTWRS